MSDLEFYFAKNDPTISVADEAPAESVRLAITQGIGEAKRIIAISSPMEPCGPFFEMFRKAGRP